MRDFSVYIAGQEAPMTISAMEMVTAVDSQGYDKWLVFRGNGPNSTTQEKARFAVNSVLGVVCR